MTLRAAVLRAGSWARGIPLPAVANHPQIELVAVWARRGADLFAAVTSRQEDLVLVGDDGRLRNRNPSAVDFIGACTAMLDDLLARLVRPHATSARATASSLQSAVAMAEVLDLARARLSSQPGSGEPVKFAPSRP